jgi:hypothetical protein
VARARPSESFSVRRRFPTPHANTAPARHRPTGGERGDDYTLMPRTFTFDSAVADVHLAGLGRYVGVASGDTVYSVDTMTHGEVFHHAFDSEVLFVCPLPNEIELAVQTLAVQTGVSMRILHLTSGQVRDATPQDTKQCERSIPSQGRLGLWKPTKEDVAAARRSKTAGLKPNGPMSESGDYRLLPCLPREGTGDILLMLDRGAAGAGRGARMWMDNLRERGRGKLGDPDIEVPKTAHQEGFRGARQRGEYSACPYAPSRCLIRATPAGLGSA